MFDAMNFQVVTQKAAANKPAHIRMGQFCFNELYKVNPTLANKIRATPVDPFYRDERLPQFWAMVHTLGQE